LHSAKLIDVSELEALGLSLLAAERRIKEVSLEMPSERI